MSVHSPTFASESSYITLHHRTPSSQVLIYHAMTNILAIVLPQVVSCYDNYTVPTNIPLPTCRIVSTIHAIYPVNVGLMFGQ